MTETAPPATTSFRLVEGLEVVVGVLARGAPFAERLDLGRRHLFAHLVIAIPQCAGGSALDAHSRRQGRPRLRGSGEAVEHAGLDRTRGNGVDAHTGCGGFERRGFRHAFDSALAGRVDRCAGRSFMTIGRGDVDDTATTLSLHHTQLVLHARQRAEHVGVEGGGIALGRLLRHQARLAFAAGVLEGGGDPAVAGDGLVDQFADLAS